MIGELSSLALGTFVANSVLSSEMLSSDQKKYVVARSKATLEYLREAADKRTEHLKTITTNGNILAKISFAYDASELAERVIGDGFSQAYAKNSENQ